jgi:hypothetical protein
MDSDSKVEKENSSHSTEQCLIRPLGEWYRQQGAAAVRPALGTGEENEQQLGKPFLYWHSCHRQEGKCLCLCSIHKRIVCVMFST